MTAEQIKQGYARTMAAQNELQLLLELLVKAIDYCSEASIQNKHLTPIGNASITRMKELFCSGEVTLIIPKTREQNSETVSDILMAIWAGLFFYPQLSEDRLLIYAESAELLCILLDGGWFA